MNRFATLAIAGFLCLLPTAPLSAKGGQAWTDPEKAAAEDPDFQVQGEYAAEGKGLQVTALSGGKFRMTMYPGGLPGAGWTGKGITTSEGDAAAVTKGTAGLKKVERKSDTLGKKAPEGAVVLFSEGDDTAKWANGKTDNGLLMEGTHTVDEFGDFQLHLEFRLPYKPQAAPGSQDRGNSGLYMFNRYECQILDSFGNNYDESTWPNGKAPSRPNQWCGSFYKTKTPDVPMCLPPLSWQTYDIEFKAPRFDADGKKTSKATITVRQNGVLIHDQVELAKGTGAGGGRPEIAKGQLHLQGHGNPVRFRNIWIVSK